MHLHAQILDLTIRESMKLHATFWMASSVLPVLQPHSIPSLKNQWHKYCSSFSCYSTVLHLLTGFAQPGPIISLLNHLCFSFLTWRPRKSKDHCEECMAPSYKMGLSSNNEIISYSTNLNINSLYSGTPLSSLLFHSPFLPPAFTLFFMALGLSSRLCAC
jgi:hypothetical protein